MNIFKQSIKKLGANEIKSPEVYSIMFKLRSNLKDRLADNIYGYKVD